MKNPRGLLALGLVVFAAILLAAMLPSANSTTGERTFELVYTTRIQEIPETAKRVEIWLPYAQTDPYQQILKAEVSSPYETRIYADPEYGNSILHLSLNKPTARSISVTMRFEVTRREHVQKDFGRAEKAVSSTAVSDLKRWLEPDRLVPIDQRIKQLALEVTAGKHSELEKARAIYDYVVSTMKYDKSGRGWGNGDIYWACDYKRGNCTDFHALFIGLCRAVGIPAKFEIGFSLPPDKSSGEVPGYHCWSEFYLNGYGWVPVDASEASKNPTKREYFFGAHDPHRVQFSIGRDILLQPPQAGARLNYFIYPYVEVDGKRFTQVSNSFRFRDLKPAAPTAARILWSRGP